MSKNKAAQELLRELRVTHYEPYDCRLKLTGHVLLIAAYLVQPFWHVKSGTVILKNSMCSSFCIYGMWSIIASSNSHLCHETSHATLTLSRWTDGSVLLWIFPHFTIRGCLTMHNYVASWLRGFCKIVEYLTFLYKFLCLFFVNIVHVQLNEDSTKGYLIFAKWEFRPMSQEWHKTVIGPEAYIPCQLGVPIILHVINGKFCGYALDTAFDPYN